MRATCSFVTRLIIAGCTVLCGCNEPSSTGGSPNSEESQGQFTALNETPNADRTPNVNDTPESTAAPKTTAIKRTFLNPDSASAQNAQFDGLNEAEAVEQILRGIHESLELGPTLVVWLFDQSDSSFKMVTEVQTAVGQYYQALSKQDSNGEPDDHLLTAVIAFGEQVKFLLEEPSGNPRDVLDSLDSFRRDSSGKEATFAALRQARDRYLAMRTDDRREVMFIVVTDEAGDDVELLDGIIDDFNRYTLPVYVIGVPAPFGRAAALSDTVEKSIRQGPETREVESIQLAYWGDARGLQLMDSGFGPFDLERLCRASGGKYLALRPDDSHPAQYFSALDNRWPTPHAYRFDPAIMHRYAPQYSSATSLQPSLAANSARFALHQAAKLEMSTVLGYPPAEFVAKDEAQLQRSVSEAQKIAARMEPIIDRFYQTLKQGEADRDALEEPRLQAAFDLAMGRVLAAKARIEGYNSMLAKLKRGMKFAEPNSDRWYLQSASVTEEAGSSIEKLGTQARELLTRVVQQHPGTPWAKIAERELNNDMGWTWTEHGPEQ